MIGEEAVAAVASAYGQQAGELTLGASQTIGQYVLPSLVASFLKSHPRVTVTVRSGNSDAILESLVAREIHMALIEGPEQRKDLHIEPFMEDHMVLVVPAGHEWADHELEVGDMCRQKLMLREFGSGSRRVVEQALAAAGIKAKDLCTGMEFDSNEGLLSAVGSRAGRNLRFAVGGAEPARVGNVEAGACSRPEALTAIFDGVPGGAGAYRQCGGVSRRFADACPGPGTTNPGYAGAQLIGQVPFVTARVTRQSGQAAPEERSISAAISFRMVSAA